MTATGIYHNHLFMGLPVQVPADGEPSLFEEVRKSRRLVLVMTIFAAVCILVSVGAQLGGKLEVRALAGVNAEMARTNHKLTAEVALKDARFQASKGVMGRGAALADLLAIQAVLDRYALVELHNGNAQAKTADEVRREACARLEASGFPCVP